MKLCTTCGTVGPTRRMMKGSLVTEFGLWCFFLVPGLLYTIWRHSSVYYGCAKCGAATVIPLDSPVAKKLLPENYPVYEPPLDWKRKPVSPKAAWGIVLGIIAALAIATLLSR